ncbi:hypothetical protein SAMN04488498_11440 [Mesorhizobium albiziae]|uniref:Uncharacterized protein n=1 Tax=Neomesorhizobium albiziae TaxID=335020 RepID=A0A1I4CQ60_9HYPH|nr:hypothetical protein [Mesorhizobium albiziae]GLS30964.1 hypothetical protein GCM10007937_26730 [Mesorhizobium albiziae]SFK83424.1 hypothetical protein SAMN04488498_11440 [Mesorhizobium albiziae]
MERWLLRSHKDTALQRITSSAILRAFGVLLRHHPGAAFSMLGAGAAQAGRAAVSEVGSALHLTDEGAAIDKGE